MNKIKFSNRLFNLSLFCGLLCAVFICLADFDANCENIRNNVLRLHIIANSDDECDQQLKLKIRDKILEESSDIFSGDEDINEAVSVAKERLSIFTKIANEVIAENGFDYKAKAEIGPTYFETREYDDFTLPAGEYESLLITVGKGEGKNWWCVIFPQMCVSAAAEKASLCDTVSSEASSIAENPQRYVMRFKTVEIYENIKKFLKR